MYRKPTIRIISNAHAGVDPSDKIVSNGEGKSAMTTAAILTDKPVSSSFSVDEFTAGLLAGLAEKGKSRIAIGNPRVEGGFRAITELLRRSALAASNQGQTNFAFQILEVLEELQPDPNSGLLEGFWASLRRQQPGRASVPNPSYNYLQLRLSPIDAKMNLENLPAEWKKIVHESVDLLMKGL